jgi:hypothetical protein
MEALIVILGLAGLGLAAQRWGVDTARADDREPHRSL